MAAHAHDDIMVDCEVDEVGLDGRPCATPSQPAAAIASIARACGEESLIDDDCDDTDYNTEEEKMKRLRKERRLEQQRKRRHAERNALASPPAAAAAAAVINMVDDDAKDPLVKRLKADGIRTELYIKRTKQFDRFLKNDAYQFVIATSPEARHNYGLSAMVHCLACKSDLAIGNNTGNWVTHIGTSWCVHRHLWSVAECARQQHVSSYLSGLLKNLSNVHSPRATQYATRLR